MLNSSSPSTLGHNACDRQATGFNSTDHSSLGPAIQPAFHAAERTPVQTAGSQNKEAAPGVGPQDGWEPLRLPRKSRAARPGAGSGAGPRAARCRENRSRGTGRY